MNGSDTSSWHELIDEFFTALERHELWRCRTILAQLQAQASEEADHARWCAYLEGILANEQEHDWGKAEQIFTTLLAQELEPALRGRTLLALGRTYEYQGRWHEAVHAHQATLPLFAELGQAEDQAKAYKNMALAYWWGFIQSDLGAPVLEQAITWCHQALNLLPSTPSEPDWLVGSIWNTLGLLHRCRGESEEARACFLKDLEICQALDDRHGMGLTYGNLGEIYQKLGPAHWPAAQEAFEQALHLIREFDNRYDEIEALANLAYFYQESNSPHQALHYWDEAIQVAESLRRGISSEQARTGFFATLVDIYANAVLLAQQLEETGRAFAYAEQARARSFLDLINLDQLTQESTQGDVAASHPLHTPLRPATLPEVQSALPAHSLLLAYFTIGLEETRLDRASTQQGIQRHRFPPPRILLFAMTRDDARLHVIHMSPNTLRPNQLASVVERHFLQPQIRRTLYDRLIAPVADRLAGVQRLYVVPHGPLHYIPFAALLSPDGDTLLSSREVSPALLYSPSATLLLHSRLLQWQTAPLPGLTLGYNGGAAQGHVGAAGDDFAGGDLAVTLHFAEEEAKQIALFIQGESWVGAAPKKAALLAQAAHYRMIHFSCHGIFDPERPLASALYLAEGEALTAREILEELQLRADLVTLSACESGLSLIRRGDELTGLLQAFLHAGAANILATLWRVDERSTRLLMERFYRQVGQGMGYAEALLDAQRWLMGLTLAELPAPIRHEIQAVLPEVTPDTRVFADPYFWAPFILVGGMSQS